MDRNAALGRLEQNLKKFLYKSDEAYIDNLLSLGRSRLEAERLALWDWPHGVGLYGIYKQYVYNGDESILDYLEQWYDSRIAFGLPQKTVNTVAPLLTLSFLYERRPKEAYRTIMMEWADWIVHAMDRTREDGLQHRHAELENPGELWDDTLLMTVLFLAKASVLFDSQLYRDEAIYQVLLHLHYLSDTSSGLFYHAWSYERNDNFAKALWGRGNAWITIFIPEFLAIVECDAPLAKFLTALLTRQLESLERYQDESGLWHTLIDDPSSYLEASASAGFCFGYYQAMAQGLLSPSYRAVAERALKAIISRIDEQGRLGDVSYGTNVGLTLEHYRTIRLEPMQYGQALAMLALIESKIAEESGLF